MIVAGVICLVLVASVTRSCADWRVSSAQVEITRINADVAVDVAQINADTAVKLAEIAADTTKKTDATFIIFYMVRYLLWTIPVLLLALVAALVWRATCES